MARRFVFRSVLAIAAGSFAAACYWITPYSDLTSGDGVDAVDAAGHAGADAAALDASVAADAGESGDASDAAFVDPDLLGYWTFEGDEAGIARDRSGLGHDLLLEGDAIVGAPGYDSGAGAQYPGGNGVVHSDALGSAFPPAGTLSMRAFFPQPTTDAFRAIFDMYDSSRHHLFVRYTPGRADAAATTQPLDFVSQIDTGFDFYAFAPVPTQKWTHLVITWDRTTLPRNIATFYVDGTAVAGAQFSPDDASIGQHFAISNGYGGTYDDVALWKRAFSEEEVREIP